MLKSNGHRDMEIDTNISDVLREVIAFLECLRDAQLPLMLESLREKLLARSKETLSITTMTRGSPEPYLDMNSGPKSLLLKKNKTESVEYIGMEESKKQNHQDYYETFENEGHGTAQNESQAEQNDDETDESQTLIRIYKNLSATQIKSKCHKCGPLKKEGKKLFRSESRTYWVALVGSHLLIYRTERNNRPCAIYPIRGYMARPAPNLITRDRQKNESAFEMYRPGNETLRFIARTPKDMDQWIAKIGEVGGAKSAKGKEARKKRRTPVIESPVNSDETATRSRDAEEWSTVVDRSTTPQKGESTSNRDEEVEERDKVENPPPLPSRIPRRLPSLPPDDDAIPSYKATVEDDDDDDDIYHKIEDLRNGTCYQNMMLLRKQQVDKKHEAVAYDDVVRASEESNNEGQMREEKSGDAIPSEETYDDIGVLLRINAINANSERQNHDRPGGEEERQEFYDDVENLISNGKFAKDRAKDQTEISSKSPQKKSFLNRVLSRKESPGKSDKRYKGKTSSSPPPSSTKEEAPNTYDDIPGLTLNRESLTNEEEELPDYNCPPPPRPIYIKPTIPNKVEIEEFYDDVSACREQYKNQQTSLRSAQQSGVKTKETTGNANTGQEANEDPPQEEIEHYQSPKSDLCIRDTVEVQQHDEDLYDDIALWEDFTSRQRDISGKKDTNEDPKSMVNSDKRSWNRFAVNRKSRSSESEINRRSGANECEEIEDSSEGNNAAKRNTFQKLISRMENSLAKVSARGNPSSLPTGKSTTVNNNS
ncbi:uncharacterized protein [Anoplolepis gracilipes]|uniref:uncharacterized protein n=1 Tax=Anoplolepis gracilipes TaxID=354296 RepID=UPI003BA22814